MESSSSSSSWCPHLDLEVLLSQPAWALGLAAVGLLTVLRVCFGVARWVYVCFLRPAKPLRRRYGSWAVVTGASDGIGRASAGVSYPYARYFHEVDDDLLRTLVKVNVEGVTRVTQALLPAMLERKRGAIVNIGSDVGLHRPRHRRGREEEKEKKKDYNI